MRIVSLTINVKKINKKQETRKTNNKPKTLIVGASIAGLRLYRALQQFDIAVNIIEN